MSRAVPAADAIDPTAKLAASVGAMLATFGVTTAANRDSVADVTAAWFAEKGLDVDVVELRWGRLVLGCDPVTARLVAYERAALAAELESRCPGEVSEIVTSTRRH